MTGLGVDLRPYQVDALERTAAAEARGVRRQLGVAATGLGKTVMFCALAQQRGTRTLILAHRDELVSQAAAKVREVWPGVDVGIVKADRNEHRATVVVASVQSLSRDARLDRLLDAMTNDGMLGPVEPFGLVVVDEAHHATADSYRKILDRLDAGAPERECPVCAGEGTSWASDAVACYRCRGTRELPAGPLLVGVTATPDRGDGKGLDDLFDEIVWSYDILWGIRSGYLSDLRGLAVHLNLDVAKLKVSRGDYEAGAAGRALTDAGAPEAIVSAWLEHAHDRRTLAFTPTVDVARQLAATFRSVGITAEHVHGGTPVDDRRAILARYHSGETQVVTNCAVLTEGFDEPRTDCVVIARPTKARALYAQMIGRGTRRHPDKTDCLVLDVVGASDDLSLVTVPSLFGVAGKEWSRKLGDGTGSVTGTLDEIDAELVRAGVLSAEEADLFHQMRSEGIAWVSIHEVGQARRFHRPLGHGKPIVVLVERDDDWCAGLIHVDGSKEVLRADPNMELVQGVAEDYIRAHGKPSIIAANAGWKSRRPTRKQLALARRLGISIDRQWNAGQVSDAIDRAKQQRLVRSKPPTRAAR